MLPGDANNRKSSKLLGSPAESFWPASMRNIPLTLKEVFPVSRRRIFFDANFRSHPLRAELTNYARCKSDTPTEQPTSGINLKLSIKLAGGLPHPTTWKCFRCELSKPGATLRRVARLQTKCETCYTGFWYLTISVFISSRRWDAKISLRERSHLSLSK